MPCQALPQKILFNLGEFAQYKKNLAKDSGIRVPLPGATPCSVSLYKK